MPHEALSSSPTSPALPPIMSQSDPSTSRVATLKRRASSSFEGMQDDTSRKRLKEYRDEELQDEEPSTSGPATERTAIDGEAIASDLEQELQCGCCAALVYRPVVVMPCQHFYCGSCIVLWIRNGGTSCPACRSLSTVVAPSRALQTMVDLLLRAAPSKGRPVNERMQADEIYRAGVTLRIPSPRQPSPEPPLTHRNANYVHPCPHCPAENPYNWRCPRPIVDPEIDADNAWHTEDGSPPGHAYCGNCENVLALQAPSTTKCDFCQVSFCGIGIPGRCVAGPLLQQHLHGLSDLGDLIQCGEIYDCFDGNTVEVDIMLDYLTAQRLTPRHMYREIIAHIQSQPRQFAPLIELELFMDVHSVAGGADPGSSAPRNRICRVCATEIFLWGLRDWWIRERKKGFLEEQVTKRPDCPEGSRCNRQKDYSHAKEFNHIIAAPDVPSQLPEEAGGRPALQAGAPLSLPSAPSGAPALPPLLEDASDVDIAFFSRLSAEVPGSSSQDFRDEVDALL